MDLGCMNHSHGQGCKGSSEQIMPTAAGAEQGKSSATLIIKQQQKLNHDYNRVMSANLHGLLRNHHFPPSALDLSRPISPAAAEAPNHYSNRRGNIITNDLFAEPDNQQIIVPVRLSPNPTHHAPPADCSSGKAAPTNTVGFADNYSSSVANYGLMSAGTSLIHGSNGANYEAQEAAAARAKIAAHPAYPRLVLAFLNCNKVGAPPEIAHHLEELCNKFRLLEKQQQPTANSGAATTSKGGKWMNNQINDNSNHSSSTDSGAATVSDVLNRSADPELDDFMEAYCNILWKHHDELSRHFSEAICFMNKIELKFSALVNNTPPPLHDDVANNGSRAWSCSQFSTPGHYDEDVDAMKAHLKEQLLGKYSGYIASLKQEFLKKKKKGKLPKDARQKLLTWWDYHYKWPYPSEGEKVALAEATGLDQKQINNWFINQRKRHWKPAEDVNTYAAGY